MAWPTSATAYAGYADSSIEYITSLLVCLFRQHYAIRCGYHDRAATIGALLQVHRGTDGRAMVFCETKRDADELALNTDIRQETHVIHGDIPQDKREMVLKVHPALQLLF